MGKLFKRRTIGPAYERCPAERIGEWGRQNLLILLATGIGMVVWWFAVDALVAFFNFLKTGGDPDKLPPFDADSLYAIAARIIGTIIIMLIMIVKSRVR